jgi:hypothetical protein
VNLAVMLTGRPVHIVLDSSIETATTDCVAQVRITPEFFLQKETRQVGFGTVGHESAHIRFSPYGAKLLVRANKEGGKTRGHILNIILDRKDDLLVVDFAPGIDAEIRGRLPYIATMHLREKWKALLPSLSHDELTRWMGHIPPVDLHEDFFRAAKWHRQPRFVKTKRAMKYITRLRLLKASPEELLWIAQRIHTILGEPKESHPIPSQMTCSFSGRGRGKAQLSTLLCKIARQHVSALRRSELNQLLGRLGSMGQVHPGPISVGTVEKVAVTDVPPDPTCEIEYQHILAPVAHLVDPLVQVLRTLDNPSEFVLHGQDEGDELDRSEIARIACGIPGYYQETIVERDIDAEVHLALDMSGSMAGAKIAQAKQLVALFTEAMLASEPNCNGFVWGYNSSRIFSYGTASRESGFVRTEGSDGNADTHLLAIAGERLACSHKRRKILIMMTDDGPDNIERAGELARTLLARGILVIHMLIGVHGAPNIYPIELLFSDMQECIDEFSDILKLIITNLR